MLGRISKNMRIVIAVVSFVAAVIFVFLYLILWPRQFDAFFNEIMMTFVFIVIIPSAIADFIHNHWMKGIENQMPVLVRGISEVQETGLTFIKGFERVVEDQMIKSPLADEVKKLTVNLSWGLTFEEALEMFRDRIKSTVVDRFCALVLEADRSGGEVRKVFTATAGFMEEMKEMEQETTNQMRPYVIIVYAAFFVYLFTSIILLNSFFIPLVEYGGMVSPAGVLSNADFTNFFYRTMMTSALMGGLMAGKIGERRTVGGLKHAIIQISVGYIIFFVSMPPNWMVVA